MAGWDATPWFVGGGANHSPEVARLLAYAATSGAEGIVAPNDLKVTPLDVPGGAVRVLPGAALVLNRAAGGGQQTYVARLPEADQIEVAPTGSSGGRSDLIVAQIEDPFLPGEPWQAPSDPTVGPYVFTRVITNVPAGTTRLQDVPGYEGRSAVALARVDFPASTGTVTEAMVTDLRSLAMPRTSRTMRSVESSNDVKLTSSSYVDWPTPGIDVAVPTWANHVTIRVDVLTAHIAPNVGGYFRITLDGATVAQENYNYDLPTGSEKLTYTIAGDRRIVTSQGLVRQLKLQGRRTAGSGYLVSRNPGTYVFDIQFTEVPE